MLLLDATTVLENVATICGLIGGGGGLVAILSIPTILRKAKAEAKKAEGEAKATDMDNMQKAIDQWKEIANERQEENQQHIQREAEMNAKIDSLYEIISTWRDKYNAKSDEVSKLEVYKATNEVKLCMVRGCNTREPQSGY